MGNLIVTKSINTRVVKPSVLSSEASRKKQETLTRNICTIWKNFPYSGKYCYLLSDH
jgi:hypothetical protein